MGAVEPSPGMLAARTGATRPVTRLRKLATPVPAPRTGAGKISGVNAYRTPYMMFCANASIHENSSCDDREVPKVTKKKRKTADTKVEMARVPRRPRKGDLWSTV